MASSFNLTHCAGSSPSTCSAAASFCCSESLRAEAPSPGLSLIPCHRRWSSQVLWLPSRPPPSRSRCWCASPGKPAASVCLRSYRVKLAVMERMIDAVLTAPVTNSGSSFLLVLALIIPLTGVLLAFVCGGRQVERIALGVMPLGLAIALTIALARPAGASLVYPIGGWMPPLGVALRADGLSIVMMVITAVVICAIAAFARADFSTPADSIETRAPFAFWILLLAIWAALNTIFLGGDLFTLYVALELLTFAAVPLVCLDGRVETLRAALRYLLFALLGSALYLLGTALLYGRYGTLDIVLLSHRVDAEPATLLAAALMTTGLLAKTALFPLHLWLPAAHAGAPAAASAVLSALVVKGSFFIAVRLWLDVFADVLTLPSAQLLAALGAGAILVGNVVALRQVRLKLLVAYSTVAQIGYLFLMFPLIAGLEAAHMDSA